jgi:outer membrane protein assembly factor BamB
VSVVADGSGKIAWQNNTRLYVPSPIVKGGHVFGVLDAGLAFCWKSDTGQEVWKERLEGDFFSSPVMVGERIYASNVRGQTFVFEATPRNFRIIAQNQLGDEAYATPAICGSRIYLRVAKRGDKREEFLYCVGDRVKAEAKAAP